MSSEESQKQSGLSTPGKLREFHPQLLTDLGLSLSAHPARVSTLERYFIWQNALATFGKISVAIYMA